MDCTVSKECLVNGVVDTAGFVVSLDGSAACTSGTIKGSLNIAVGTVVSVGSADELVNDAVGTVASTDGSVDPTFGSLNSSVEDVMSAVYVQGTLVAVVERVV